MLYGTGSKRKRLVSKGETGPSGAVQVEIKADGRTLWQSAVRAGDKPRPIDVDLTGAKRLQIVVDYGDNLDVGDELVLGDLRLVK